MVAEKYLFVAISSGISASSCLSMLYLYHHSPLISRLDGAKHIYILQLLDMLLSLFVIIPAPILKNDAICNFQAFGLEFCTVSGVLWTGFISFEFYMRFYLQGRFHCITMNKSLIFCLGIGLLVASMPLTFDGYSDVGTWCSVKVTKDMSLPELAFIYGAIYGIIWVTMSWNICMYIIVINKYKKIQFERPSDLFLVTRLKLYPIVLLLCYLPITISRILQTVGEVSEIYELVASVLLMLLGFVNAIVYGYSPEIKKILLNKTYNEEALATLGGE